MTQVFTTERSLEGDTEDRAIRRQSRAFLFATAVSILLAFVGYAVLERTSEFHRRNLLHLIHLENVQRIVDRRSPPSPAEAREELAGLAEHLSMARSHAVWCIGTLSRAERIVMSAVGAEEAESICREDAADGLVALAMVSARERGLVDDQFFREALSGVVDRMIDNSARFYPHVERVEGRALQVVRFATALFGLLLLHFVLRGTRTTRSLWRARREQRVRFDAALAAMEEGFAIYTAEDRLLVSNAAYRELSSARPEDIRPGMRRADVFLSGIVSGHFGQIDPNEASALVRRECARLDAGEEREFVLGGDRYLRLTQQRSALGDRVLTMTELTTLRRQQIALQNYSKALEEAKREERRRALEDALTGLPNRRAFEEHLESLCVERAGPNSTVTLIRVDLDHFKYVNDTLGHAAGDAVLCSVAASLQDVCGGLGHVARIGGDEFVVSLSPGQTSADAEAVIAQLVSRLSEPFFFDGRQCRFGASFGIASTETAVRDADELLSFADAALYRAKQRGRGRAEVFTPHFHDRILENRRLADEIRAGLERGEFVPFFQPQVCANTRLMTGAEVLVRWQHPTRGLLAPGAFLDVVGQLRATGDIDRSMFDQAAELVKTWHTEGLLLPKLSFNVSSERMHEPDLLQSALRLADAGIIVSFELLESISLEEESQVFAYHVDALKDAGIRIEIDDFGSGKASVLAVMQIAPDVLKIDQRIVQPLLRQGSARRLVQAIVEIGRALGISVTAEGVETLDHARILADLGCETLQGYAFAKPMPAADFVTFAQEQGVLSASSAQRSA